MFLRDEVPSASVVRGSGCGIMSRALRWWYVLYGAGFLLWFIVPPATGCSVPYDTGYLERLEAPFSAGCYIPFNAVRFER